eukprot:TRINITY_DN13060_c0_g1_i1.p1 TRINITY_DN13060_c0_g1~~TRINITY_DN13060_c0_g1_i1.p1  ORF type:complete len:417 (+),score=46.22 TRINITY_DN13060_c0_g1_i1:55-1305(+)
MSADTATTSGYLLLQAYPICVRPLCGYVTYEGHEGSFCSRSCRGRGAPQRRCNRPGCMHPAADGRKSCSEHCAVLVENAQIGGHRLSAAGGLAPICLRPRCGRPTWQGFANAYCSVDCRSKGNHSRLCKRAGCPNAAVSGYEDTCSESCLNLVNRAAAQEPNPDVSQIRMRDPRCQGNPCGAVQRVGVLAFYSPGWDEVWDLLCKASFLSNFYYVGRGGVRLETPRTPGAIHEFTNSEAAFQATKFWDRAADFEFLSGDDAFALSRSLRHEADVTYAGFGSNWNAMLAVLRAKFTPGTVMARGLVKTADAFLLEHNASKGRDTLWSDDNDGSGRNWLGLQLMLVRDEITGEDTKGNSSASWKQLLLSCVDLDTGSFRNRCKTWKDAVQAARDMTVAELSVVSAVPVNLAFGGCRHS